MKIKVCHLTSAHPRYDTRIFVKQCNSIAEANFETHLVVADGKGTDLEKIVKVHDVGKKTGRISRMLNSARSVYKKGIEIDADIYHLHDPELIPYGLKLRRKGKKVVFDAHEDLPVQILGKHYLNKTFAKILSRVVAAYEKYACSRLNGVVAATPFIRDKFLKINPNTVDINNFPKIKEIKERGEWSDKSNSVVYIGGISEMRGIKEIVKSLEYTKETRLNLAGNFIEKYVETEVKGYPQWSKVNEFGYLDREGVAELLLKSKIGLVTLYPQPNYLDSLPVKMFEYMNAGIPVIASDFPYWKTIIEENKCGITVNPLDPKAIGEAINSILANDHKAEEYGLNGKNAVLKKYNWAIESNKLIKMYKAF